VRPGPPIYRCGSGVLPIATEGGDEVSVGVHVAVAPITNFDGVTVTEAERIKAINEINNWKNEDDTVKIVVREVLRAAEQPSVGHLARFEPGVFDDLYDECMALVANDV
jgi:hypothetical protein